LADTFKSDFRHVRQQTEHRAHYPQSPFPGLPKAMMAPVIIMGAIMMFVFWDTSNH
jgi:hypothetical protein